MRRSTDRCLLDDGEIRDAALWRLAGWSPEEIEAGSAQLARLLARGIPLYSSRSEVAQVLATFARGDRREPWTALCALAALYADDRGDAGLFLRAGFEVVSSHRQATRGAAPRADDDLDDLLSQYLRRHHAATSREVFEHFAGMAGLWPTIEASDANSLAYHPDGFSSPARTIRFHAFEQRVSRLRRRLAAERCARCAPSMPAWLELQPVAVRRAG